MFVINETTCAMSGDPVRNCGCPHHGNVNGFAPVNNANQPVGGSLAYASTMFGPSDHYAPISVPNGSSGSEGSGDRSPASLFLNNSNARPVGGSLSDSAPRMHYDRTSLAR
ncbi:MAG: hypothetical protein JNL18_17140 [Planctomycetaceae bacterium]|nr:hypothetical protein [Planctomycetaceae bacterium]